MFIDININIYICRQICGEICIYIYIYILSNQGIQYVYTRFLAATFLTVDLAGQVPALRTTPGPLCVIPYAVLQPIERFLWVFINKC